MSSHKFSRELGILFLFWFLCSPAIAQDSPVSDGVSPQAKAFGATPVDTVFVIDRNSLSLSQKQALPDSVWQNSVESILLCKSPGPIENEKGPRAALGLDMLTKAEPNPHMRDDPFHRSK